MNIFTYRHSDLPAVRAEIKAEIVALNCQIADLILRSQGNYRELEELAEILDDALNSCELNLNSIQIIPDDSSEPATIGMRNLPLEQKQIIYSMSRTNSILLNLVSELVDKSPENVARDIAINASIHQKPVSNDEIESFIEDVMMPLTDRPQDKPQPKCHYVFKELN